MTDIFGKGESSSDTTSEEEGQEEQVMQKIETGMPHYNPQDLIMEEATKDMNTFYEKINQFEKITNISLLDVWKQHGSSFHPIKVKLDLQEYIPGLFDLIKLNPKIEISKIMSVFCYLQVETYNLKHEIEAKFFDPLILFGESGLVFEDLTEEEMAGEVELQISRTLSVFNQFLDIIRRIVDLSKNIVYQMNGLFSKEEKVYKQTFKKLVYTEIFDNFGDILAKLYIVDAIIQENSNFEQSWAQYNQMFLMAQSNPQKYNTTLKNVKKVMKFCKKIHLNILNGNLYDSYLDGLRKVIQEETGDEFVFRNKIFRDKYLEYIKHKIQVVTINLSNPGDMGSQQGYLSLLINYSLYRKLFQEEDSSLYKKIWAMQKNCPIIILYNNLACNPGHFLTKKCPLKKDPKCDPRDLKTFLKDELQSLQEQFSMKVDTYYIKLVHWVIKMNSDAMLDIKFPGKDIHSSTEFLKIRANLVISGLDMCTEVKRSTKTLILMFQTCRMQPSKSILHDIVRCVQMLKTIEIEFQNKRFIINQWVILINRYTSEIIDNIIVKGINDVGQWSSKGHLFEDMMFLLTTIYESHQGGHNFLRKTVLQHCFDIMQNNVFNTKELSEFKYLCQRLEIMTDWEKIAEKSTRCRFLYWMRSLFPYIFEMIMSDIKRPNQLNYFLMALNDPLIMLWNTKHLDQPNVAVDNYKKDIYKAFTDKVIKPICRKVEEEIRLQIHQAIIPGLAQKNPQRERLIDCNKYISMSEIFIFEKRISIKEEVKIYLGKVFYQMSAMAPHDFQSYEHMRILAKEKFAMNIIPSHLPAQSLEQGIDILQLLRDLSKFVSKYNYNLHSQVFIETTLETRQIKTIGVNQMYYSIKTHGIGVMGTVINTFYQFLVKKLNVFNEFLYDDFIRQPLMQEDRYWKKKKNKLGNMYPYERADQMNRQIKRLGTTGKGVTYLDKFRQLITSIGNALGYVRMIRSASLKDNANFMKYIPEIISKIKFDEVTADLDFQGETVESIKVFDMCIKNLFKQASDAGDYLRMIVENFESITEQEGTKHLKLFYLIIPPLTMSYVEHIQRGKERIASKNKNLGGFISDDGFPLGVAYLLKILDQSQKYQQLNWFESMLGKLRNDLKEIEDRKHLYKKDTDDIGLGLEQENDKLEWEMSNRRVNTLTREYEMLNFTFSGSSILFKEI